MISKFNQFGNIDISSEAISSLVATIVSETYGVVGLSSNGILEDIGMLLKKNSNFKGIEVHFKDNALVIDIYVVVSFGIKIIEVTHELQKNIKYLLENQLEVKVKNVNIFVQGISDNHEKNKR